MCLANTHAHTYTHSVNALSVLLKFLSSMDLHLCSQRCLVKYVFLLRGSHSSMILGLFYRELFSVDLSVRKSVTWVWYDAFSPHILRLGRSLGLSTAYFFLKSLQKETLQFNSCSKYLTWVSCQMHFTTYLYDHKRKWGHNLILIDSCLILVISHFFLDSEN